MASLPIPAIMEYINRPKFILIKADSSISTKFMYWLKYKYGSNIKCFSMSKLENDEITYLTEDAGYIYDIVIAYKPECTYGMTNYVKNRADDMVANFINSGKNYSMNTQFIIIYTKKNATDVKYKDKNGNILFKPINEIINKKINNGKLSLETISNVKECDFDDPFINIDICEISYDENKPLKKRIIDSVPQKIILDNVPKITKEVRAKKPRLNFSPTNYKGSEIEKAKEVVEKASDEVENVVEKTINNEKNIIKIPLSNGKKVKQMGQFKPTDLEKNLIGISNLFAEDGTLIGCKNYDNFTIQFYY